MERGNAGSYIKCNDDVNKLDRDVVFRLTSPDMLVGISIAWLAMGPRGWRAMKVRQRITGSLQTRPGPGAGAQDGVAWTRAVLLYATTPEDDGSLKS